MSTIEVGSITLPATSSSRFTNSRNSTQVRPEVVIQFVIACGICSLVIRNENRMALVMMYSSIALMLAELSSTFGTAFSGIALYTCTDTKKAPSDVSPPWWGTFSTGAASRPDSRLRTSVCSGCSASPGNITEAAPSTTRRITESLFGSEFVPEAQWNGPRTCRVTSPTCSAAPGRGWAMGTPEERTARRKSA